MTLRETTTFNPWLDELEDRVRRFNSVHAKLSAADGDKDKAVAAFIETSEDEQAVKARERIEDLHAQLASMEAGFRTYAEQNVTVAVLDPAERAQLEEQYKTVRKEVKESIGSLTLLTSTAGEEAAKAWEVYLSENPDPTTKRLPSAESLPRLSCTVTARSGDNAFTFETLGATAAWLDINVKVLHLAVAKAAQIAPADLSKIKDTVTLDIDAKNGAVAHLTVTPKARKPKGSGTTAQTAPEPVNEAPEGEDTGDAAQDD